MSTLPAARPILIAHRAANDLPLLEPAFRAGADLVEADVWLYRANLEVRHEKTMGPIPLRWDRWKLEWRGPPRLTLEQLLGEPGQLPLLLDLKGWSQQVPSRVNQALAAHPGVEILFTARHWLHLEVLAADTGVAVIPSVGSARDIARLASLGPGKPWAAVAAHMKLLTPETIETLRTVAPLITTWPVNSSQALDRVLDLGVDGITSDNLEVIELAASRRSHS